MSYDSARQTRRSSIAAEAAGDGGTERRRAQVHARAEPGPEGHPRLGARVRRGRRAPRRRASGTSARRRPGRSSRRPRRSASTASRALAQFWADPTGLTLPIVNEELFWGDAGIGMAIMGTSLAVAAIFGQGTPEQMGEWIPQCYGTRTTPKVAAFCSSEPDAGSDVSAIRTTAKYDEAKDEWVINGQKAWATNGGIADVHVVIASVDRELGSRGHAAFVIPPGHQGLRAGREGQEARPARLAHRRRPPRRLPRPRPCLLGGKEKLDERLARVREGKNGEVAGRDADLRGEPPDGRRPGARASPAPPTSTRSTTPRSASSSAARSSRTRRSPSRSPT